MRLFRMERNQEGSILKLPFLFTPDELIDKGRTTRENIDIIRTWLSNLENKHLPEVQEELIVIFLLSCENDIPLTKNTILMYYQCKKGAPEIFDDRDMEREDIKKAMNTIHMSSIPVRTDENYAIHYFKVNDTSYSNFELIPIMKLSYMILDITQERDLPNGLVVVIDMKGFGLMHLTRLKLRALKTYFLFLQEGFPLQLKVIHVLNAVYFFDKIMNIIKVFLKSELVDMIKVHPPNLKEEKLFSMIPKKCLPSEYGGDLPSEKILHEKTVEQYNNFQSFWKLEEEIRKRCS